MRVSGELDKIVTGEFRDVSKDGDPRAEHAIQQAAQMSSIKEQNLDILDCVKETLEKKSQLEEQSRSLPEQNPEILDSTKAQQETIEKDVEVEEDDDDLDETLGERLLGLTEMFPQFMHTGTVALAKKTCSLSQALLRLAKAVTWIAIANATTSSDNLEKIYELSKNFPTSKAILGESAAPVAVTKELAEDRKTRTGMEQKAQKVDRIASPKEEERHEPRLRVVVTEADLESHIVMDTASQGDENRMTKANPVWDKRTKEAGTKLEEAVLLQVVFYFCNQRPTGTTVKQIKITGHAQGHQARHLITLKLKIVLQKFSEADQKRVVPPRGELAEETESPDKGNSETFQ